MKLSIVVCGHSRERSEDLRELLESVSAQQAGNIETIVVIDGNEELYEELRDHVERSGLRDTRVILGETHRGLSHCRNDGIKASEGEIIAFVDDDAVLEPGWVEAIRETFRDAEVSAATGDISPLWEKPDMDWFPRELHWMISCSYTMTPGTRSEVARGFGANMAFRRHILEGSDGFDTSLGVVEGRAWTGGEDTVMFMKAKESGGKVIYEPRMRVKHKIKARRLKAGDLARRAYGGGRSVALLKKHVRYDISSSTEGEYAKKLLLEFYPRTIKELVKRPSARHVKSVLAVSMVAFFEALGYAAGSIGR